MKKSVGTSRPSKGPVRISLLGAAGGQAGQDGQARPSLRMSTSRIPVKSSMSSHDHNPQSAQRQSRSVVKDHSKKPVTQRSHSSAAGRFSATPCRVNSTGKSAQTPHYGEQRRSQSAHSPFTPNPFNLPSGKKADPRPITDKSFLHRVMVKVYSYFLDKPVTLAQICPKPGTRSITVKSFYELVGHLLGKLFPYATITGSNYISEIPALMKMLKYPGNLSSSWLKSPNTMHSWPHVVAILSWLVDLVQSLDEVEFIEDAVEVNLYTNEELFNFTEATFEVWNEGNDRAVAQIQDEFLSIVLMRSGYDENSFESVRTEVQQLEAELNDPEELAAIADEQHREDQCKKAVSNEKKLHETIDLKLREIKTVEEEINTERENQTKLGNVIPYLEKQLGEINQTIATQKMSKLQVDEINKEWNAIDSTLEQQLKFKENIEKISYDSSLKSSGLRKKLEIWSLEYNTAILTIGIDNPEQIQLDMKGVLSSSLKEWQETALAFQALIKAGNAMLESRDELSHNLERQEQEQREELAKYQKELKVLHAQETALNDQGIKMMAEYDLKEKNIHDTIKSLEAEIQDRLRSDCNPSELQAQLKAATERASQCKKDCQETQERGANFLKNYKEYCMKTLEKMYKDMAHVDIQFLRNSSAKGKSV